jgi:hypothetical protein
VQCCILARAEKSEESSLKIQGTETLVVLNRTRILSMQDLDAKWGGQSWQRGYYGANPDSKRDSIVDSTIQGSLVKMFRYFERHLFNSQKENVHQSVPMSTITSKGLGKSWQIDGTISKTNESGWPNQCSFSWAYDTKLTFTNANDDYQWLHHLITAANDARRHSSGNLGASKVKWAACMRNQFLR